MRPTRIAFVVLAACTPPTHDKAPPRETAVATLPLADGRTATVSFIDESATASPEALRHYLRVADPIESRQALNDGFVATIGTETYVLREIHRRWMRCHATTGDDKARDEVIAACKAYKP